MKIAYINSFYTPEDVGGAEKSVQFLAEAMAADGHEVQVICTGREPRVDTIHGVEVHRLAVDNLYHPLDAKSQSVVRKAVWHALDIYRPRTRGEARQVLERFRPDVVHTNTITGLSPGVLAAAGDLGIPVVHTLRDYYLLCPSAGMFRHGKTCATQCASCKAYSAPKRPLLDAVTAVVGNSRFILEKHLSHGLFAKARHHVVYNAYAPQGGRRPARAADDALTLGFIGRLANTKGLEVLLQAFGSARRALAKPARLLIAGDGDPAYVESLKAMAAGLDVQFLGRVKPQDFYPRVDWCVLPSLWDEPLARVIFESFSHGVPLIASRTGGTTELMDSDRRGLLYDAHNAEELAACIARAAAQDVAAWQSLSDACWERGGDFRPASVLKNYAGIYQAASTGVRHEAAITS